MVWTIKDTFEENAAVNPNGGAKLFPAECGFILAELEGLVSKYENELKDPSLDEIMKKMIESHLLGLIHITEKVREGMSNKPDLK